jgi:hypothetical protein
LVNAYDTDHGVFSKRESKYGVYKIFLSIATQESKKGSDASGYSE